MVTAASLKTMATAPSGLARKANGCQLRPPRLGALRYVPHRLAKWVVGHSYYDTPADVSLPPPVGMPPAEGTICFNNDYDHTCEVHTSVRAVSCGVFTLWALPPVTCDFGPTSYCIT